MASKGRVIINFYATVSNNGMNRRLEHIEIVHRSLILGGAENFLCFNVGNNLRLYRMSLLFPGIPLFLFFLGRSIGLSVTSTASVRPAFSLASNAFLPSK